MSYKIFTDTSTNLPERMTKPYGVEVISFYYVIDGKEYTYNDIESFDGKAYYDRIRNGEVITTSQITPQNYIDRMEPCLKEGYDILFIGMSSGISGAYGSAEVAANQLREDYPDRTIITIDTRAASFGEAIPVLKAIELQQQGKTIQEVEPVIRDLAYRVYQVFTVDDLMYLKRTGRLSNAKAIVGTLLNIKPLLKGNDKGQIVSFLNYRGRRKAIRGLADKYNELVVEPENQTVYIAHSDCEEEAKQLAEMLKEVKPPKDIMVEVYDPVTGAHVGPGCIALFFVASEGDRFK